MRTPFTISDPTTYRRIVTPLVIVMIVAACVQCLMLALR